MRLGLTEVDKKKKKVFCLEAAMESLSTRMHFVRVPSCSPFLLSSPFPSHLLQTVQQMHSNSKFLMALLKNTHMWEVYKPATYYFFLWLSEGSASRPSRFIPPGKTRYPLERSLGGPQGRSAQVRKISPPRGIDRRTVQPVSILKCVFNVRNFPERQE
jgi:hypothetical protein